LDGAKILALDLRDFRFKLRCWRTFNS